MAELLNRVQIRLPEESNETLLSELITTVTDRLCLRLGAETLPNVFMSIAVDAVVKMYRRIYYEGISSESVKDISVGFADDILAEYAGEIDGWKVARSNTGNSNKVVRFL